MATIVSDMAACSPGSYVLLGSGSFSMSAYAYLNGSPGVSMRGSGPMSTTLNITGAVALQMGQGGSHGGGTVSASPSAGATSVTLTSVSGVTPTVGNVAWLNQCDTGYTGTIVPSQGYNTCTTGSYSDNGGIFVCGGSTACNSNGSGSGGGGQTSQYQYVVITSVTNNGGGSYTLGFTPGLYMSNWSTGSDLAMYWETPVDVGFGVGIEDMTVVLGSGANNSLQLGPSYASWMKGLRIIGLPSNRQVMLGNFAAHSLYFNNYNFGAQPSSMSGAGEEVQMFNTSDGLVLNNIGEQGIYEVDGSNSGDVLAYNYSKTTGTNYVQSTDFMHDSQSSAVQVVLHEGEQMNSLNEDDTWGTGGPNTIFRSYFSCSEEPYNTFSTGNPAGFGIAIDAFHRFDNAIANAIGGTSQCTGYTGSANSGLIFRINKQGTDSLAGTSFMRWANYDSVNAAVRCQSSEVPTSLSGNAAPYENAVPSTPTVCGGSAAIPASFFMDSMGFHPSGGTGLSWWKVCDTWTTFPTSCSHFTTEPFPTAGPDVTGGDYNGGYAYDNPAQLAYRKLPIDTTQQNSFTITGSNWTSGTETLIVSGLTVTQLLGPMQISGGNCATSGAGTATGAEVFISGSSSTTVSYALASNPGSCTGTMLWPDVRQFDERVYQNDPIGPGLPAPIRIPMFYALAVNP